MTDDREREEEEKAKETYHKEDRRPGRMIDPEPEPEATEDAALVEDEVGETEPAEAYVPEGSEAMPQIDVYGLLRMVLGMFADQAWVQMGLQLAPGAKEIKADLKQARVAIDTVNFIKDALGDNLSAEERREVEQLVATLKMNYVQRV